MTESIWAASCDSPDFPALQGDTKTDVLIVGGGLAGLLICHQLTAAGVDCLLIEADRLCAGVSRNTTAKITSQHGPVYHKLLKEFGPEKALMYYEANEEAIDAYRALARSIPCDFEEKDSFLYAAAPSALLEKEMVALSSLGIKCAYVNTLPLPFHIAGAIRFSRQGQFHPLKFAAAISKGLNIRTHTRALDFPGNTVITDRGKITASHIVIATHFPIIDRHGAYFLKMYQDRSYVLALQNAPDVGGMYLDISGKGLSLRNHGDVLLLGGGGHRTGKTGGNWEYLRRQANAYFPQAREVCHWAAQDCMTLDGIPYIGRYSKGTHNLYVATGFNKWGMTSSMVAARILCDEIMGRESPYAALFSPSRSILHPQLFINAAESTVNLLRPSRPRCPHLGCALKWNPQERSWDCPCHGSRFAEDGKLLDNPATKDLK